MVGKLCRHAKTMRMASTAARGAHTMGSKVKSCAHASATFSCKMTSSSSNVTSASFKTEACSSDSGSLCRDGRS